MQYLAQVTTACLGTIFVVAGLIAAYDGYTVWTFVPRHSWPSEYDPYLERLDAVTTFGVTIEKRTFILIAAVAAGLLCAAGAFLLANTFRRSSRVESE